MPRRVLIIPDKFKGTLDARRVGAAIRRGWLKERPADQVTVIPMSDGGDGFGAVLSSLMRAWRKSVATMDAAHQPCLSDWWWEPRSRTAILECAKTVGLAMLPPSARRPLKLDTEGLGVVIRSAAGQGAQTCVIGLGGSATNDGGFGVARALGWTFLDSRNRQIRSWSHLHRLARIIPPETPLPLKRIIIATDVQNKLLGHEGATRVFGPQKGLGIADIPTAERNLAQLAKITRKTLGKSFETKGGAGAAGGLGFGLMAFAGAKVKSGFEVFSEYAALEQRLAQTDLVITGEGRLDWSTMMGKGVGELAKMCKAHRVPCLALAGCLEESPGPTPFELIRALTEFTSPQRAQAMPSIWLARAAAEMARTWLGGPVGSMR